MDDKICLRFFEHRNIVSHDSALCGYSTTYRHLECNRLGMLFRQIPLSCHPRFSKSLSCFASLYCRSLVIRLHGTAHRILLQRDFILCNVLCVQRFGGCFGYQAVDTEDPLAAAWWLRETWVTCQMPYRCRHAFNNLIIFNTYLIHSNRPPGWCIPCLQCGKRPAATAKPVKGYMRPRLRGIAKLTTLIQ